MSLILVLFQGLTAKVYLKNTPNVRAKNLSNPCLLKISGAGERNGTYERGVLPLAPRKKPA